MAMHNPPHPGEVIRDLCLEALNLSVTDAAKKLKVTRKALSELVNGHSRVSPQMAVRISKAFGGSPESWLRQQMQYDLWKLRSFSKSLKIDKFQASKPA